MGDEQMLYVRNDKDFGNESSSSNDDVWDDSVLVEAYDHAVGLAKSEVEQRMNGALYEQNASSSECSLPNVVPVDQPAARKALQKKSNKKRDVCPITWSEGDPCRCMYSVDGKIYEAYIMKISHGGACTVKYVGYDNEEDTYLSVLHASHGDAARTKQANTAMLENALGDNENPTANGVAVDNVAEPHVPKRRGKKHSKGQQNGNMDWEPFEHAHSQTSYSQGRRSQQSPHQRQHFSLTMPHMPQMVLPPPPPLNILAAAGCPSDEAEALSAMLMSWYMSGFHTGYYQGMKTGKEQASAPMPRNPPRKR